MVAVGPEEEEYVHDNHYQPASQSASPCPISRLKSDKNSIKTTFIFVDSALLGSARLPRESTSVCGQAKIIRIQVRIDQDDFHEAEADAADDDRHIYKSILSSCLDFKIYSLSIS